MTDEHLAEYNALIHEKSAVVTAHEKKLQETQATLQALRSAIEHRKETLKDADATDTPALITQLQDDIAGYNALEQQHLGYKKCLTEMKRMLVEVQQSVLAYKNTLLETDALYADKSAQEEELAQLEQDMLALKEEEVTVEEETQELAEQVEKLDSPEFDKTLEEIYEFMEDEPKDEE